MRAARAAEGEEDGFGRKQKKNFNLVGYTGTDHIDAWQCNLHLYHSFFGAPRRQYTGECSGIFRHRGYLYYLLRAGYSGSGASLFKAQTL